MDNKDYQWNEEYPSQKKLVRAHLLKGKSITQIEALNLYGSIRLSAIIFDLREEGLPIITSMKQVSPRKRCGEYHIPKDYLESLSRDGKDD